MDRIDELKRTFKQMITKLILFTYILHEPCRSMVGNGLCVFVLIQPDGRAVKAM